LARGEGGLMVVFSCDSCGDAIKKPKVAQHLFRCRPARLICVDCGKDFDSQSYSSHTSCISEAEKYQGSLYRRPNQKKGQQNNAKQQQTTNNNNNTTTVQESTQKLEEEKRTAAEGRETVDQRDKGKDGNITPSEEGRTTTTEGGKTGKKKQKKKKTKKKRKIDESEQSVSENEDNDQEKKEDGRSDKDQVFENAAKRKKSQDTKDPTRKKIKIRDNHDEKDNEMKKVDQEKVDSTPSNSESLMWKTLSHQIIWSKAYTICLHQLIRETLQQENNGEMSSKKLKSKVFKSFSEILVKSLSFNFDDELNSCEQISVKEKIVKLKSN